MQQITGLLNFISKAIVPGRAFTRRMYCKFSDPKLKQHYHLKIDQELKADCSVWLQFLSDDRSVCRPFVDFSTVLMADKINFFTDASGAHQDSNNDKTNDVDPVNLIREYLNVRGSILRNESEQFFIFRDHSPVQIHHFRVILKKSIKSLDLDQTLYDTHSLHIGRAKDLFKPGKSVQDIMQLGRWKSNAMNI